MWSLGSGMCFRCLGIGEACVQTLNRYRQARERETTHVNELRVIEDQINKIGASRQQNAQNLRTLQVGVQHFARRTQLMSLAY